MCVHAYVTKRRDYYDKQKGYRIIREHDICIFCGKRTQERISYMNDPPRQKLPYFGEHLK